MGVVNHRYLSRKLLGDGWRPRLAWAWSELGFLLLTVGWLLAGRGVGSARGDGRGALGRVAGPRACIGSSR